MKKEREYTAVYKKTGAWITAWIEEVPGVNTQGRTMLEARENLADALKMVLRANRELSRKTHILKKESFSIRT